MNGKATNVSEKGAKCVVRSVVMAAAVTSSNNPKPASSSFFCGGQTAALGALQLRINGVTMIIPVASPCHHVHQFLSTTSHDSEWPNASGTSAPVAAIAALRAHRTMNLTTSS